MITKTIRKIIIIDEVKTDGFAHGGALLLGTIAHRQASIKARP